MSLMSENVIPGYYGKIFESNAKTLEDQQRISKAIMQVEGVKDVIWAEGKFPRELTIHTNEIVSVKDIEKRVSKLGFHVIPQSEFPL